MIDLEGLNRGHAEAVNSVILSDEGKFMISVEGDSVQLWDAVRGIILEMVPSEDFETIREGRFLPPRWQMLPMIVH